MAAGLKSGLLKYRIRNRTPLARIDIIGYRNRFYNGKWRAAGFEYH
jgi:hypothetical protein